MILWKGMDTFNFFWIASSKYYGEARDSAYSVRKHHENANLVLFAVNGDRVSPGVFDSVVPLKPANAKYWFLESVHYWTVVLNHFKSGDKLVYLDTDTHVCGPLDDVFWMLDRFDFVGVHAPGRRTAPTVDKLPVCLTEYNVGVNGVKVSKAMRLFVGEWYARYKSYQSLYKNNDQAPLRETIWNYVGPLKFGTMPIEYNFRFGMGGQVREPVCVLHGRSDDYERLEKMVNPGSRTIRAWRTGELK